MGEEWMGTVKWWSGKTGVILSLNDWEDYDVRAKNLLGGIDRLFPDARVIFQVEDGAFGLEAINVRLVPEPPATKTTPQTPKEPTPKPPEPELPPKAPQPQLRPKAPQPQLPPKTPEPERPPSSPEPDSLPPPLQPTPLKPTPSPQPPPKTDWMKRTGCKMPKLPRAPVAEDDAADTTLTETTDLVGLAEVTNLKLPRAPVPEDLAEAILNDSDFEDNEPVQVREPSQESPEPPVAATEKVYFSQEKVSLSPETGGGITWSCLFCPNQHIVAKMFWCERCSGLLCNACVHGHACPTVSAFAEMKWLPKATSVIDAAVARRRAAIEAFCSQLQARLLDMAESTQLSGDLSQHSPALSLAQAEAMTRALDATADVPRYQRPHPSAELDAVLSIPPDAIVHLITAFGAFSRNEGMTP